MASRNKWESGRNEAGAMRALRVATSTTNATEDAYVHLVVYAHPEKEQPRKGQIGGGEKGDTGAHVALPPLLIVFWFQPGSRSRNGGWGPLALHETYTMARPHHSPGNRNWRGLSPSLPSLSFVLFPNMNTVRTSYSVLQGRFLRRPGRFQIRPRLQPPFLHVFCFSRPFQCGLRPLSV